jgi:hypothetical protein
MSTAKHFLQTVHFNYWDVNALIELAGKQGYRFTADELQAAADELWGQLSQWQYASGTARGSQRRLVAPRWRSFRTKLLLYSGR